MLLNIKHSAKQIKCAGWTLDRIRVLSKYPAADIERYKSSLTAGGYPEDFHKIPFQVIKNWNELPEEIRQTIRERGVGIVEMRKIEETEDGDRIVHPYPKFQTESKKQEGTEEDQKKEDEKHLEYIQDSGFQLHAFEDGEVGIKIDPQHIIGLFPSLETAYRYFKEGHHLTDIGSIKQIDSPTVH